MFDSANEVAALEPDHRLVAGLDVPWVIATAPGELGSGTDFVLRYFAAGSGIDEDPVTGSALCVLGPYWAARLGRTQLVARQISARGGRVECEVGAERVVLRGRCADYLEGWITVPG